MKWILNYVHNNLHPPVVISCSIEIEAQIIIQVIFTLMRKVFVVVISVNHFLYVNFIKGNLFVDINICVKSDLTFNTLRFIN